jgi:hypothetical protein
MEQWRWYRRAVGDTDQPGQGPVDDAPDDGQHSVQVAVRTPARVSSRPVAKMAFVAALLGMLALANGHTSAIQDRSLNTSDPSDYVERLIPTTTDATSALPTVMSVSAINPELTTPDAASVVNDSTPTPPTASPVATVDPTADPPTSQLTVPSMTSAPVATSPPTGSGSDPRIDVSRAIPDATPAVGAASVVSPWADKTSITAAGYVATDVGCASGTSASSLDAFFRDRVGPAIGLDYQHVYPLGGKRYLWIFQDTFIDYGGTATNLAQTLFAHNTAMIQDGTCFTLYHRGTIFKPSAFEPGDGGNPVAKWFWPMGGQTFDGKLYMFWAEMQRDGYDPTGADGLGWHPTETWLGVYDAKSLNRLDFSPASNSGTYPIYGYAVDSDASYTYLFGNTFEQNLQREGGYDQGPHSATKMFLARVPLGNVGATPEYYSNDTWTADSTQATPISERYWAENPMEPRYLGGHWVAATKVDGYWGDELSIDVAIDPWGPWTTVERHGLSPRGGDPLKNTYHAYLMPWLSGGSLVVSVSNNAKNMLRDAWPSPERYRPMFFGAALVTPPPSDNTTTTSVDETPTTVSGTTATNPSTPGTNASATTSTTAVPTTTPSTTPVTPPPQATPPETTPTGTVPPDTAPPATVPAETTPPATTLAPVPTTHVTMPDTTNSDSATTTATTLSDPSSTSSSTLVH